MEKTPIKYQLKSTSKGNWSWLKESPEQNRTADDKNFLIKNTFKNWNPRNRWVVLLPICFLFYVAGEIFGYFFGNFMVSMLIYNATGGLFCSDIPIIVSTSTKILTENGSIVLAVLAAHDVAPKRKKEVGIILGILIIVMGIYGLALLTLMWNQLSLFEKISNILIFFFPPITASCLILFIIKHHNKTI